MTDLIKMFSKASDLSITFDGDATILSSSMVIPPNINYPNFRYFHLPEIKDVIFNDPATIVFWEDGTKTIVKCQTENGDTYSKETGLAMAIVKKAYGNKGNFNDVFNKWLSK